MIITTLSIIGLAFALRYIVHVINDINKAQDKKAKFQADGWEYVTTTKCVRFV